MDYCVIVDFNLLMMHRNVNKFCFSKTPQIIPLLFTQKNNEIYPGFEEIGKSMLEHPVFGEAPAQAFRKAGRAINYV